MGPGFLFGHAFPDHLPPLSAVVEHPVRLAMQAPRNAMPSLHTAWLLLNFLAMRQAPLFVKLIGGTLLAGTVLATLGFGEHYGVDLIGALPLVLLVRGICAADLPLVAGARRDAILAGIALLACWVLAIRDYRICFSHVEVLQVLAAMSVVATFWLERRLAHAEASAPALVTGSLSGHRALAPQRRLLWAVKAACGAGCAPREIQSTAPPAHPHPSPRLRPGLPLPQRLFATGP